MNEENLDFDLDLGLQEESLTLDLDLGLAFEDIKEENSNIWIEFKDAPLEVEETPTPKVEVKRLIELTHKELEQAQLDLKGINAEIENSKMEFERMQIERDVFGPTESYRGGMWNFMIKSLNTTQHTMILIGHVFLGYIISGLKYEGISVWKSKSTIIFYIAFSIGYFLLTALEYARVNGGKGEKKDEK